MFCGETVYRMWNSRTGLWRVVKFRWLSEIDCAKVRARSLKEEIYDRG